MKRAMRVVLIAVGILVVMVTGMMLPRVAPALAEQVTPGGLAATLVAPTTSLPTLSTTTAKTHLGVPPSDIVTLGLISTSWGLDLVQNFPDGTKSACTPTTASCFRVPAGKVLVVTDVEWSYGSGYANKVETMRLLVVNNADPTKSRRLFESTIPLNGDGNGGTSVNMTTGFVVSSGGHLEVETTPDRGAIMGFVIRGYLMPER